MAKRGPKRSVDWLDFLDFEVAATNCAIEIAGDWYRDPWSWPEVQWAGSGEGSDLVVERLNATGVRRTELLDVAKENFGIRPALVVDPVDRLAYQALVDYFGPDLISDLDSSVLGWRLHPKRPERGRWQDNGTQHEMFRDRLGAMADWHAVGLKTDVVSCFASIPLDDLCEQILDRTGAGAPAKRVAGFVSAWGSVPSRSGLMQRSTASAAIANMYLQPLDNLLTGSSRGRRGRPSQWTPQNHRMLRWMDDIWVFGRRPSQLRRVQVELQDAMRSIGLEMNLGKTAVLEGPDLVAEARELQHSAAEEELFDAKRRGVDLREHPEEAVKLNELIDELVNAPEVGAVTSIKFVTKRLREYRMWDRVDEFVDVAQRMPHGAEALGRLFRESGEYQDLGPWFARHLRSPWSAIDLSAAGLGLMFPANKPEPEGVVEELCKIVEHEGPLALLAFAAQRLSAWRRSDTDVKLLLQDAATACEHPLKRRVLALSMNAAGARRGAVKKVLGALDENRATLGMLEACSYRVAVNPHFTGGR